MFENIGGKLKGLAKFLAVACVVCGVLVALIGLVNYISEADCLEYATAYGGSRFENLTEAGNKAYAGLQMLKYGLIAAVAGFLGSWPLYGFGELIENTTYIVNRMEKERE